MVLLVPIVMPCHSILKLFELSIDRIVRCVLIYIYIYIYTYVAFIMINVVTSQILEPFRNRNFSEFSRKHETPLNSTSYSQFHLFIFYIGIKTCSPKIYVEWIVCAFQFLQNLPKLKLFKFD
jgi:hypothetical protein